MKGIGLLLAAFGLVCATVGYFVGEQRGMSRAVADWVADCRADGIALTRVRR